MPCAEELARYFLASDLGIVESSTHFIYNGQRVKEVKNSNVHSSPRTELAIFKHFSLLGEAQEARGVLSSLKSDDEEARTFPPLSITSGDTSKLY